MKYMFKDKEINIPDKEIDNLMNTLDLTEEEAIETWLDDNDYTQNEEVERLTAKAKENRIMATIHEAKSDKPRAKRVIEKKEDVVKEDIIKQVAQLLGTIADKVEITNVSKIVEFDLNGDHYKLDLIRQRKPKNKGE